jgi:hypothetical protein
MEVGEHGKKASEFLDTPLIFNMHFLLLVWSTQLEVP